MHIQEKSDAMLRYLVFLFTFLFSINAISAPIPDRTGYVTDLANKLSSQNKESLNKRLGLFQQKTHKTIAVLIVPSLQGEPIEDLGYKVANTWGIGQKGEDTGVLLLLSIGDRKSRIEVGKGLGGDLTDIESSYILQNELAPHMRSGNTFQALISACNAIALKISKQPLPDVVQKHNFIPQPEDDASVNVQKESANSSFFYVMFIGICSGIFLVAFIIYKFISSILEYNRKEKLFKEEMENERFRFKARMDELKKRTDEAAKKTAEAAKVRQEEFNKLRERALADFQETTVPDLHVSRDLHVARAMVNPRSVKEPTPHIPIRASRVPVPVHDDYRQRQNEHRQREEQRRRDDEERSRKRREEEDRQREDARRRSESYSSYSSPSYSSYDSSSSSSSSSFGSSGGFDGGSFGGGGASGDW
jgi:uncharacterized membrane protein YgcG